MSFALLALLCAVAMLGPIVSLNKMLRIPVVIGELAIGIILGRSGLSVINSADPQLVQPYDPWVLTNFTSTFTPIARSPSRSL